jgi:archaellum component FlaC
MIYADEAIDAITTYKTVKDNMKAVSYEISMLAKSTLPSTEKMLEVGERYNQLKGALELLTNEADRIWHQHEDFFATSGITF